MKKRRLGGYLARKIGLFLISVLVLSMLVFAIARLAPGDPLLSYYGERATQMSMSEREHAMERLGLNEPIPMQYVKWLTQAFQGDFGISYKYKRPVTQVIANRALNTLLLGGIGYVSLFILALFLGGLCAWHEGKWLDKIITRVGTVLSCIPEFFICILSIMIWAVWLQILPATGAYSIGHAGEVGDRIWHLIMPLTLVVTGHLWYYAYMVRNKLLEEVREDYVLLAKSKGLTKGQIMFRHCLRKIMPSYISMMAISVSHVLGGTYIIESIFAYPGIGSLAYEAARYHDYNLLMLVTLISGIVVIFFNILGQGISEYIDPRMKAKEAILSSEVAV